ncbi:MAG: SIS domain-containing protein [Sulfolobaceae archaeon]|nr:SIS domain-containing protein [Sulfolobaceae archaeon]
MDYISAIRNEIIGDIRVRSEIILDQAYVTGAGDSYAAALVIEGKTGGRFRAIDPHDALYYEIDKPLVLVSVSGRTRSVIELAKRYKGVIHTIAVTANRESELAKNVDFVVEIPYKSQYILPGIKSFLLSVSALYSIASLEVEKPVIAKDFVIGRSPFFVGSLGNYGIAYYLMLKMFEIFGEPANAERLELFSHSPIFSTRNRQVVILSSGEPVEEKLASKIKYTEVIYTGCKDPICNAVTVLNGIINRMEKEKWNKIYFLEDKEILNISSEMIY